MTTATTRGLRPLGPGAMGGTTFEADEYVHGSFEVESINREFTKFQVEAVEEEEEQEHHHHHTVASFLADVDDVADHEDSERKFTAFQVDVDVDDGEQESSRRQFRHVELESREVMYADVVEGRSRRDQFFSTAAGGGGELNHRSVGFEDGSNTLKACFHHTLHLLSSVLTAVASVKAFLGRWKVIEHRLSQLPALLQEMSQLRSLSNSRVCSEVLKDLVDTLEGAGGLAVQCTNLSYGGKLQTQSNLDTLCGRLNFHIHDCQLILTGEVMHENPLAICRMAPDSGREAMQWTVQDLLAHLQIGSGEGKEQALDAMVRLMSEDDKNVVTVAGQGAVATLVHLLDSSQGGIRERAAAAVCLLALNESYEHVVVAEGGVAPLVRLLESGTPRAQERAAASLQALTSVSDENARAVAAQGGIPALIELCRAGTPAAVAAAVGALRNLADVEELRKGIVEEGAIPIVITLVDSGTAAAQEHAAATLQNLAAGEDDTIRWRIAEDGAVQPLLRYLDGSSQASAQETALGALRYLAACRDNIELLRSTGFLPRLAACLRAGTVAVQVVAASAVCQVGYASPEARRALGEAGVIGPLVKLLDAKSPTLQESTAQALALLLLVAENQKLFLAEDWGIEGLVLQLDTRFQENVKQFPVAAVAALQALSGSAKCRKQMITSGACFHLRHLANAEVPGAKKLLNRLEGNKLKSIISKTLMVNSFTN